MAISTKMNCACAVGRASATSCGTPLAAPIIGNVACVRASISASINANCPISGIIHFRAESVSTLRVFDTHINCFHVLVQNLGEFLQAGHHRGNASHNDLRPAKEPLQSSRTAASSEAPIRI